MFDPSFAQPYRLGQKTVRDGSSFRPASAARTPRPSRSASGKCRRSGSSPPRASARSRARAIASRIYARYAPGCYINAVGLANPGAAAYLAEFDGDRDPRGQVPAGFDLRLRRREFPGGGAHARPIADGFELNMSCPHAKGYGAQVGQDTELMRTITAAVVGGDRRCRCS